jgi:hypothetical protein
MVDDRAPLHWHDVTQAASFKRLRQAERLEDADASIPAVGEFRGRPTMTKVVASSNDANVLRCFLVQAALRVRGVGTWRTDPPLVTANRNFGRVV